jgi:hypothetical protein
MNIYNKKTKGSALMNLFTATGKLKWSCLKARIIALKARITAEVKNIDSPILTRVWQNFEYRICVCRVTRDTHIEHL